MPIVEMLLAAGADKNAQDMVRREAGGVMDADREVLTGNTQLQVASCFMVAVGSSQKVIRSLWCALSVEGTFPS